ncbi:MAG: hypothetical protein ACKOBV_00640 [Candidatus Kapaibacterium sp.]
MATLVIVALGPAAVCAQGFDWEYSARFPGYASSLYAGIGASVASDGHTTDLTILEAARAGYPEVVCTAFEKGSGTSFRMHAAAEYWAASSMSFTLRAGYAQRSSVFSGLSPKALMFDGSFLQTSYELSTDIHAVNVEPAIKMRVPGRHVWACVGLRAEVSVSSRSQLVESVTEPSGYVFPGTTSRQRILSERDRVGLRGYALDTFVAIGLDVDAGTDRYVSPAVVVGLPLLSRSDRASWTSVSLGLQVAYFFAMR